MKHKVVAITGGIGSGKSCVAQMLRQMGFCVLFCDKLAAEVAHEKELLDQVRVLLGDDCVTNGQLNRKAVRERVFCDDELYLKYSKLFWERTKQRLLCEVNFAEQETVFVEIPVISAFRFDWHEIWLVESEKEIRLNRVTVRDGVSEQNVLDIMAKQPTCENYTRKIVNDGSLETLKKRVENALKNARLS